MISGSILNVFRFLIEWLPRSWTLLSGSSSTKAPEQFTSRKKRTCCVMDISVSRRLDRRISVTALEPLSLDFRAITLTITSTPSKVTFGPACSACWGKRQNVSWSTCYWTMISLYLSQQIQTTIINLVVRLPDRTIVNV